MRVQDYHFPRITYALPVNWPRERINLLLKMDESLRLDPTLKHLSLLPTPEIEYINVPMPGRIIMSGNGIDLLGNPILPRNEKRAKGRIYSGKAKRKK